MSVSLWASTNPFDKTIPVTLNHFCRKLPVLTQPISGSMRTLGLCGQLFSCDWYDWHLKTFADSAKALLLLLLLLLSFFFRFNLLFKGGGTSCVAKRFLIFTSISFCSGFNPLRSIGCSRRSRCGWMTAAWWLCSASLPEGKLSGLGNLDSPRQHMFHRIRY